MKKILIVVLILIIASAGGWLLASQTGIVNNYALSFQSGFDISKCENISISNIRGGCYLYEAIKSNNPTLCKLGGFIGKSDILLSYESDCLQTIAINTRDISVCQKIETGFKKIRCESIVSKNSSKCREITKDVADWWELLQNICNVEVAVLTENATACEYVIDGYDGSGNFRKASCYQRFETKYGDYDLCGKKSNFCNLFKLLCVARSGWGDSLCKGYPTPFIQNIPAIDTLDATKCDNSDCYLLLAYQTNNAELCKGESKCYNDIAVRTKNPNICSKIEKEYERDSCIKNIAVITKNSAICNNVNTTWMKSSCVAELSK